MPSSWLALGVLAGFTGVAVSTASADPVTAIADAAEPSDSPHRASRRADASSAKRSKLAKSSKPAKTKKPAKSKRKTKRAASNMPRGFVWPPSRAMLAAGVACERALRDRGVAFHLAPREGRIVRAVIVDDSTLGGIAYVPRYGRGPYKLDCQLALALDTLGPALHAAGVRSVQFGSIYRWSNVRVNGVTKPALSRHALGLAMDVVSFVDETGREANIARDYPLGDPFLLAIEQAIDASGAFRIVLTPSNDPISHHDHFHIEANPNYTAPLLRRSRAAARSHVLRRAARGHRDPA